MDEQEKKQLEEKLALAEKERDEYLNGWKRAKADLINAKREWAEQLKGLGDFIKTETIKQFLPVLDAMDSGGEVEGLAEIKKLFLDILKKAGLEEIKSLGEEFDPACHESVGAAEGPEHQVVEVTQKGYRFKGQIIRAAKVRIGKMSNA